MIGQFIFIARCAICKHAAQHISDSTIINNIIIITVLVSQKSLYLAAHFDNLEMFTGTHSC